MPLYLRERRPQVSGANRVYSDKDLYDLLWGLGLGGSGGGGGYLIGQALVKAIIREIPVTDRILYSVSAAADDDFAVMAGGIGAPSAITPETITTFAAYAIAAIDAYSREQKKKVNALVPVEAGPVNALLALYLGWKNKLKVFDCDGDGRAVPSLTNLVFGYNDYPISPSTWPGASMERPRSPLPRSNRPPPTRLRPNGQFETTSAPTIAPRVWSAGARPGRS